MYGLKLIPKFVFILGLSLLAAIPGAYRASLFETFFACNPKKRDAIRQFDVMR